MDAALEWFALLQGYPDDHRLRAKFEAWRRADTVNERAFAEVAGVWELAELDVIAGDLAGAVRGARTTGAVTTIRRSRRRSRTRTHAAMAAAALILIAVGVRQYPAIMLNLRADYQTATGVQEEITLPDGSHMMLNTASAVALDFEGGKRSVTLLQGEAYFDVVPDPSRPFTVVAAFFEVEVKGTAFAARTGPKEDTVVLERGLVEVARLAAATDTVALRPGESITATATALSGVTSAHIATSLSWRHGRLVFENEPFAQVLGEISRYYSRSIFVTSDRIGNARVTGNYRLDNPERTIRSLAATVGATVTRIPGGILILR